MTHIITEVRNPEESDLMPMQNKKSAEGFSNEEATNLIHDVANLYTSTKRPHDYGTGDEYTSNEVHTLLDISRLPRITVTDLALRYGKTKGAVSQIIKKLESKRLITRSASGDNDNRCFFELTELGKELNEAHCKYDAVHTSQTMDALRQRVTPEEFNTAFRVLSIWLEIRRRIHLERTQSEKKR